MTPLRRVPQTDQIAAKWPNDPCREKKTMTRPVAMLFALATFALATAPLQAQNLFTPRVYVNDRAITEFEVQQRTQMLRLFRTPGDVEKEAVKGLIEDRLRLTAAQSLKIAATPEQIKAGMEEFASRANLTADQFITALGQAGVSAETFRDFVQAGLVWREVVRQTYVGKLNISDAEVDRAIANGAGDSATGIDYAQYSLPAATGAAEAAAIRAKVDSCDDLYAIAKGQPTERLIRETKAASAVPANISRALAALDPGESVDFPSGAGHVFLMLCARNPIPKEDPTRAQIREQLLNDRVTDKAQTMLEELRFNAIIREP